MTIKNEKRAGRIKLKKITAEKDRSDENAGGEDKTSEIHGRK